MRIEKIFRPIFVLAFLLAAAHAHAVEGPRMASRSVAKALGYPACRVSVALTEDEFLATARRLGIPDPQAHPDWSRFKATYRSGDEIRLVSCRSGRGRAAPGYSIFGVFRGGRAVLEAYQVVDN